MPRILKSRKRVNFQDCDPLRHLNNLNYIQYFINTREDELRNHNVFDIEEHALKTGNSWVVISHNIKYVRPATMGELVEIWSRALTCNASTILVEFLMFCPKTRQLKAIMHSEFAYCSIQGKKMTAMDADMETLVKKSCLYPGRPIKDFSLDNRISQVKQELE